MHMMKKLKRQKKDKVTDLDIEQRVEKEWKYLRKIYIKDEDHLLFASFIILLVGVIVLFTLFITSRVPQVQSIVVSGSGNAPTKVLTSEQTAKSSAYTINISNATENSTPDRAFSFPDNYTMLILDFTITNNSSVNQNFIPVNQLYIRSNEGVAYPLHASMNVKKPVQFQNMNPGETQSGQISFAIPKTLAYPLLYVDLGWNDYVPVVFNVLK
jgi:hypothetical protein